MKSTPGVKMEAEFVIYQFNVIWEKPREVDIKEIETGTWRALSELQKPPFDL